MNQIRYTILFAFEQYYHLVRSKRASWKTTKLSF